MHLDLKQMRPGDERRAIKRKQSLKEEWSVGGENVAAATKKAHLLFSVSYESLTDPEAPRIYFPQ